MKRKSYTTTDLLTKRLDQKNFDTVINSSLEKNTPELTQYFSQDILNSLSPYTNEEDLQEAIFELIDKIQKDMPGENSFSVGLERHPNSDIHSKKHFFIKKDEKVANIGDIANTHPWFKPNKKEDEFSAETEQFNPAFKNIIFFDKKDLDNPDTNKSPFVAYLSRALGYCKSQPRTYGYNYSKDRYVNRLIATEICNQLIQQGFPVLEGFGSRENFNDFVNLHILGFKDPSKEEKRQYLLSQENLASILQSEVAPLLVCENCGNKVNENTLKNGSFTHMESFGSVTSFGKACPRCSSKMVSINENKENKEKINEENDVPGILP